MGILIEPASSSPQHHHHLHRNSDSPEKTKLFKSNDDTMDQYHPPMPVPTSQPLMLLPPTSSPSSEMTSLGPPGPHLHPLNFYGDCKPLHPDSCWGHMPPLPHESDPEGGSENSHYLPLCAGCRLRIKDKYFLSAVDVKWHSHCLKCVECGVELETQNSCFEKDGHIYCKEDYRRIYNVNKCARCLQEIQPSDLVMKAKQLLFHVNCFTCDTCATLLKKGDLFGMFMDHLYCRLHYEMASADGLPTSTAQPPHAPVPSNGPFTPVDPLGHSPDGVPYGLHLPPFPPPGPYPPPPGEVGWYPPPDFPPSMGGNGGGDFQYGDNNNEPMLKKRRGRKKRKVETFAAMNGYLEAGGYSAGMDGQGGPGKTKRARTSFKHHQLRIMKHHFQINQNPDSRELKILSQKTQLDKKVLQVWFQNARAKWRRTRAQEPGSGPSNAHNAGMGPGGPGGPDDGDLGLGSPSSDCSGPMIPCC